MRHKIIGILSIVIVACFCIVTLAMTLDWVTKYYLYLSRRDEMYLLIKSGVTEIEGYKRTVAYLQGAATRQVNNIKGVGISFSLVLASFCLYKKFGKEKV